MNVDASTNSMWRYSDALPLENHASRVTLGEGWTPLLSAPVTAAEIGCAALYIKDESQNPSGTFKDRSASYTISALKEQGVAGIVLNSTGNASASFAIYAARAGMRCVAIVPDDVLDGNLMQMRIAGAEVHKLSDWGNAIALAQSLAKEYGFVDVSAGRTPHRSLAKRTIGYEIAEQLGWTLPGVLSFPTGGGTAVLAIQEAFQALSGSTSRRTETPQIVVSQYTGCAPIAAAHAIGLKAPAPCFSVDTPRGGMRTPAPALGASVLAALVGGGAYAIDPEEALEATSKIASSDGIILGLESGTALVALQEAIRTGIIDSRATAVVVNTSTLLKSDPAYTNVHS